MNGAPVQPCGILLVDKPEGPSSFDVVRRVRRAFGRPKAGHTGTLDPLATGVLPICLGEATKIAGLLLADDKEYRVTARLGLRTDSYDVTGKLLQEAPIDGITRDSIEAALEPLRGVIEQMPPAFSALKRQGRRAYELARQGAAVALDARRVTVHALTVVDWAPPLLRLHVHCGKGTYVRSLVADLGERLGCGATVSELRRLRSGQFSVDECVSLEQVEQARGESPGLLSIDAALDGTPVVQVSDEQARRLVRGQVVHGDSSDPDVPLCRVRLGSMLVALGRVRGGIVVPQRVFVGAMDVLARGTIDGAGRAAVEGPPR